MDNIDPWVDQLSDKKNFEKFQSWSTNNNFVPFDSRQITKLYNLYNRDPDVYAAVTAIVKNVFYGKVEIIWDPRTPFLEKKKRSEKDWILFLRDAATFYYMFGMVPYKVESNQKKVIPVIPDHNSGYFAMKARKKTSTQPKVLFISKNTGKKKGVYGENNMKVFIFDRRITISDPNVPSPLLRLLKSFYELSETKEGERRHIHRMSNGLVFAMKDNNNEKAWKDLTQGEEEDPEEQSALVLVKKYADRRDMLEMEKYAKDIIDKGDSRDVYRRFDSPDMTVNEHIGRSLKLQPLPSGFRMVFDSPPNYDFKISQKQMEYQTEICTQLGIDYGAVFGIRSLHPGRVDETIREKLKLVTEELRNMLEQLFLEAYQNEFPIEEDTEIVKEDVEEEVIVEEKVQRYKPKDFGEPIILTKQMPLFPPYIKWEDPIIKTETRKLDQNIVNAFAQGLIDENSYKKHIFSVYPELEETTDEKEIEEEKKIEPKRRKVEEEEKK